MKTFKGREARKSVWNPEESVSAYFPVSVSLSNYLSLSPSTEVTQLNFCSLEPKEVPALPTPIQTHGPLCLPYGKDTLGILEIPCKYSLNPERRKKVTEKDKLECM